MTINLEQSPVNFALPNMWRGSYTLSVTFGGCITLGELSMYCSPQLLSKMICPNFQISQFTLSPIPWIPFVHPSPCLQPSFSLTRYDWRKNEVPPYYSMGSQDDKLFYQYGDQLPSTTRIPRLFSITSVDFFSGAYEPSIITRTRTHTRERFHGPSYEFYNWRNIK